MDNFTSEAFTLLGVGIGVVGLREYARIAKVGFGGLAVDDYLMVVAVVSTDPPTYL